MRFYLQFSLTEKLAAASRGYIAEREALANEQRTVSLDTRQ